MFLDRGSLSSVQSVSIEVSPRHALPTVLATQYPANILCCIPEDGSV